MIRFAIRWATRCAKVSPLCSTSCRETWTRTALHHALDAIIRIRAVQDLTASQAVGFVFLLKPILLELQPERNPAARDVPLGVLLNDRIDRLALMAFDKYMQCREQLADIRVSEGRRRIHVRQVTG